MRQVLKQHTRKYKLFGFTLFTRKFTVKLTLDDEERIIKVEKF